MNAARKAQVKWWASKVYEQAQEYADIADPKRKGGVSLAMKLDAIASYAKRIQLEIELQEKR